MPENKTVISDETLIECDLHDDIDYVRVPLYRYDELVRAEAILGALERILKHKESLYGNEILKTVMDISVKDDSHE